MDEYNYYNTEFGKKSVEKDQFDNDYFRYPGDIELDLIRTFRDVRGSEADDFADRGDIDIIEARF